MLNTNTQRRPVKTVEKSFEIIEFLKENNGGTLNEIAEELGVAKSTAHRHLETLQSLHLAIREGNVYHPSLRFLEIGEYTQNRKKAFRMAEPKVQELAAETEERAQFIVEEHGIAVYVHRAIGEHAVQTDPGIGKRAPIHATAAGKAILAYLPEEYATQILEQYGQTKLTEYTITDRSDLFAELDRIREQQYSHNNQEMIEGLRAVGVPVLKDGGSVMGAFSVSGPTHRMKGDWFEQDLPDLMLGVANELELNLTHDRSPTHQY